MGARTGWRWCVGYVDGDTTEEMIVYGAMTIEEALRDAHQSLSACQALGIEPDYVITAIERLSP